MIFLFYPVQIQAQAPTLMEVAESRVLAFSGLESQCLELYP